MEHLTEDRKIEIGPETIKHLNKARKWTMFLSVSGFIFFGLIIVIGLITGTFLTAFNNGVNTHGIPDIYVIGAFTGFALVNFFPTLFLFRFSKHASKAVSSHDSRDLHKAMKNLRLFFLCIGILLIIAIAGYIAGLVISGSSLGFFKGF